MGLLWTWLNSLPWMGKVPKADGVIRNLVSNKCYFGSNLKFVFQPTSNRYDLVLLGKCLGFAPRSESFAIEPSVQVCSISSLSEFRFAEMSCFATPASASSIRTQIRYAQLTKIHFQPKRTKNTLSC